MQSEHRRTGASNQLGVSCSIQANWLSSKDMLGVRVLPVHVDRRIHLAFLNANAMNHMSFPNTWLQPDWPAIDGVQALFTSRHGGVSQAPFDTMNLGDHVHDRHEDVQRNRQMLTDLIRQSSPNASPVFLRQVHGCGVLKQGMESQHGSEADACVTNTPGAVCTIMVADCLPVLFAHQGTGVVGAAHAGWRGLAGVDGTGVLEETFAQFAALVHSEQAQGAIQNEVSSVVSLQASSAVTSALSVAADTQVWLGPCIGPKAFEVGNEVRDAFCAVNAENEVCFEPGQTAGKWWANLPLLARHRLGAMGISRIYGNDGSDVWCTVTQESLYFSHRRDAGRLGSTGRMAACIWKE